MIDGREALRKMTLNALRYSGLAPLAAPFLSGLGAILMLHRVNREPPKRLGLNGHLALTPDFLDALLSELKRAGYAFVTLEAALEEIRAGRRSRFLALTADDAYRDNLLDALPVLESHDVPITIYVSPGLTGRRVDPWWDVLEDIVTARDRVDLDTAAGRLAFNCEKPVGKRAANAGIGGYLTTAIPEEERQAALRVLAGADGADDARAALMGWDEVREIARHRLVTIGAHTVHHYNLMRLSDDAARREIAEAADMLEAETGERPRHMAYPYGHAAAVGPREVELAHEAGYASAVTTRHGVLLPAHARHLHALPRISLNGRYQRVSYVRTMLSGVTTAMANGGRRLVTV